jgi:hypothetical protein
MASFSDHAFSEPKAMCLNSKCDAGRYMAGFAKVDISPKVGVDVVPTMTAAPQLLKKIHDPLYAKAIALSDGQKNIAFVALDLCFLVADSFEELQQYLVKNSNYDHIVLTVTHTHSGMFDHNKLDQLKSKSLKALDIAWEKLEPVEIGASSIAIDEAYNRRIHYEDSVEMFWKNPERQANRPVDNALGVIHIKTIAGDSLATIINYSAHPTVTMDLENVVVSADYPGAIASYISKQLGGNVLFLPGAGGDVNPYDTDTKPLELAIQKSNVLGKKLGAGAVTTIKGIEGYTGYGSFSFSKRVFNKPKAEISALMLTPNIAVATFPGEYFNDFGEQLKAKSPVEHTFFVGYSNGSIAYVPTEAATKLGGYGAELGSNVVRVSSTTGQQHTDAAISQLRELNDKRAINTDEVE